LEGTEDGAELARREKPGPERAWRVLADRRETAKGGPDLCGHVGELPADLVVHDFWPVGSRQDGGPDGIRGGRRRNCHVGDRDTTDEATANLFCRIQLSSGRRPRAGDERPRTLVIGSFSLEQPQDPLCTIGCPSGDKAPIGLA
jgi:hypothetical protein